MKAKTQSKPRILKIKSEKIDHKNLIHLEAVDQKRLDKIAEQYDKYYSEMILDR